jgi:hypothetical protein
MQARVKSDNAKPAKSGEADVGGYKRAISAFDRLTGGKALAARDVKRISDSLGEDEALVDAAKRLKPLIDRLAGG